MLWESTKKFNSVDILLAKTKALENNVLLPLLVLVVLVQYYNRILLLHCIIVSYTLLHTKCRIHWSKVATTFLVNK